jgi:TonB family protein
MRECKRAAVSLLKSVKRRLPLTWVIPKARIMIRKTPTAVLEQIGRARLIVRASRIGFALFSFGFFAAQPGSAQEALYALNGKSLVLVQDVREHLPIAEVDGKMVPVYSGQYCLKPAPAFTPVFIAMRDLRIWSAHLGARDGQPLNSTFNLIGEFESPYHLEHVFLALELELTDHTRKIFLQEIGEMLSREPTRIDISVPLDSALGEAHYFIHLFTSGREVLHSEMAPGFREQVLDRMIADGIKGVQNAPPRPFIGPPLAYPKSMVKAGAKGNAVIHMRIAANGSIQDPRIVSASDPAFGDAALEAFRQWRFYPRVKDGAPVETIVEIPVNFDPKQ